ncbi:MAG: maleylpyruvate isomerase family mycothiol-dependent enzyme [Actinomycetia bacterium]|nr:maleylpyruvate isomerase family mycothiol-dependent enzyme [Actinomycetes bacterium]
MSSRTNTIDSLNGCYRDLTTLINGLSPEDWDVQSLCPDWTVREVIAHLVAIEHALSGWLPTADDNKPPFEKVGEYLQHSAELSNEELGAEVTQILATRTAELAETTDEIFAMASMTPVGPGTYHRFMDVRVFDFWVHQRDMAQPLGIDTDDSGPAAEIALDEVDGSIGYIVGKKIGLPDGMSMAVRLTGPVGRDIYAAVEGRAARVEQVDDPTITLTTDSRTFVQLACGRLDPQQVIDEDRIRWSGDAGWGEKAARNLAFTM